MAELLFEIIITFVVEVIFESLKFLVYYIGYFFLKLIFGKKKRLEKRYFFNKEGKEEYFNIPAWIIYTVGTFLFFAGIIGLIYYLCL